MKKGKIIAIILSMCVLGPLGKNILVSMASYKYGGFRNVKNTTNSTTSNEADYNTVYINKVIYSFVAEESKKLVFSTPLEYADNSCRLSIQVS